MTKETFGFWCIMILGCLSPPGSPLAIAAGVMFGIDCYNIILRKENKDD